MFLLSPGSGPGGSSRKLDSRRTTLTLEDLQALSKEELVSTVADLESRVRDLRRELRGSTDQPQHAATHTHDDGYDVCTQQRVAVLVDVQNMYYAARNLYNSKLEFSKLLSFIGRGRMLTRAIAYIVERPGMEQEKFVEVLKRNGYEVRKKILIERADGSQKGDWDLGIALDAVAMADKVDSIVLVTGDGDFVTLAHFLQARGVRCEVASFPETTALELIRASHYYHRLNDKVLLPSGQFHSDEQERSRHLDDDADEEDEFEQEHDDEFAF